MKRLAAALLLCLIALPALAHKASDSYLTLSAHGTAISVRWDIALRDLDYALGLDANGDRAITWGELRVQQQRIARYALARLHLSADGRACAFGPVAQAVDTHSDGAYTVLQFTAICADAPRRIDVDYRLLFDLDPLHRGLLRFRFGAHEQALVFGPENAHQTLRVAGGSAWRTLLEYGVLGLRHIASGIDHLMFLLALLIPSVLERRDGTWCAREDLHVIGSDVFKTVTAFTAAHSLTLALSALGVWAPPSRWVESLIAASIVFAAVHNLYPWLRARPWMMAFAFGLVHGFGFASALIDLGLPTGARAAALLGFNLGVEVGQLVVVTAWLPLAYLARASVLYQRIVLKTGSAAIAVAGFAWLISRAFNVTLAW